MVSSICFDWVAGYKVQVSMYKNIYNISDLKTNALLEKSYVTILVILFC
jgi:hypothetical protein